MDEIDDAMKLRLTEIRLNNLDRRNKKLVDILASSIMNNIYYFFDQEEKRKQIQILPDHIREKMLRLLEKQKCYKPKDVNMCEFEIRFRAFETLLHENIKVLDVTEMMRFISRGELVEQKTVEVLRVIAERAPNIESLSMNNYNYEVMGVTMTLFGDALLEALGKLEGLKKLVIRDHNMRLNDLKDLCREKLKNLQHFEAFVLMNVEYRTDLAFVEDFKRSFSNLRVFIFNFAHDVHESLEERERLRGQICRLGLLHLPNLKIIHEYANRQEDEEKDFQINELPSEPSSLLHLSTKPTTLGLHLAYPDVTDLLIDWTVWTYDEREVNAMLQFPKIEGLNFKNIPSTYLIGRFLNKYGANLKSLILIDTKFEEVEVKFSTILDSCPNLEQLQLYRMNVTDHSRPIRNFAKLKTLEWETTTSNTCLSQILAAPQLESFVLFGIDFDLDDLELMTCQISQGLILRNLTSFYFAGFPEKVPLNPKKRKHAWLVQTFLTLSSFIKNACAYLPKLTDLSPHFSFDLPNNLRVIEKNYSDSHKANLYDKANATAIEHLGDKTLVHFFGVFNRRKYFPISSQPTKND